MAVAPALALLVFLIVLLPTLYADLAIAFDGQTLVGGLRSSLRFWRRFYLRSAVRVIRVPTAPLSMEAIFVDVMEDGEAVFPPVLLAMILALGLLTYAANCLLIGFFADRDAPDDVL